MGREIIDLTNKVYGRLTIISYAYIKNHTVFWNCKCACGTEKVIAGGNIKKGTSKSCGCIKNESVTTHGMTRSLVYKTWHSMMQRCLNINNSNYEKYGGRGIKVCDKWLTFEGFYEDMGDRLEGKTLDRIDNNGDYCKANCKWSTNKEQSNNKRNNNFITYNGKTQTLSQWADDLGVKRVTLKNRLLKYNWSIEKTFTTKVRFRSK